jgi:hypothetical protein
MSKPQKSTRRRRLFPRSVEEVVRAATKPLMDKQGKLHAALLRDWEKIVGAERARITRPSRLQFPAQEASGATLHVLVRPSETLSLSYELEPMLEQCARYFGYRAIARIVLHASHDLARTELPSKTATSKPPQAERPALKPILPEGTPDDIAAALTRIAQHVSPSDK